MVSDRGTLFTAKFWASFCWYLATKRRLSTAYHPQTDGQTEKQNQSVEHYLRTYCNFEQDDWATHLSLAEFVYNTSFHSAINTTPAMALLGFTPRGPDIPPSGPQPTKVPAARDRANHLRIIRNDLSTMLRRSQNEY
jgi:transposase InsO family protein